MLLHASRSSRPPRFYATGRAIVGLAALAAVMAAGIMRVLPEDASLGDESIGRNEGSAPLVAPTRTSELTAADAERTRGISRTVPSIFDPAALDPTQQLEPTNGVLSQTAAQDPLPPSPAEVMPAAARIIPLPVRRPAEFGTVKAAEPRQLATGSGSQRRQSAAVSAAPEDKRSYIEKLFGVPQTPAPALSYAALESPATSVAKPSFSPSLNPEPARTAVYDLSAQVVHMPNGEKLEAHSGLGDKLDDPRYVHVRMHGATPPGTYELSERERPFHGVRALRLNPVGGSQAVHGRAGLLAHTYLLGPRGDSNGCVSFKEYDKFLQAYLRGEVTRLVVVAGRGQDGLFSIFSRRT